MWRKETLGWEHWHGGCYVLVCFQCFLWPLVSFLAEATPQPSHLFFLQRCPNGAAPVPTRVTHLSLPGDPTLIPQVHIFGIFWTE